MKKFKSIISLFIAVLTLSNYSLFAQEKSSVCFTFDDGNPKDILNYDNEVWNKMILDQLTERDLQAVLFVCGRNLDNEDGKMVLESWDRAGHIIANHTYSHLNYNNPKNDFEKFRDDILRCDSLISGYNNFQKYFRFPMLKGGETREKRDSINAFLHRTGYKNGYVTIDNSDWFINSRMIKFMEENPGESIEKYKKYYIEHLIDRAKYYDEIAFKLLGRRVKHTLLLHHNLTSALFLGDLMEAFEKEGWELINADDAFTDPVFEMIPDIIPAGESIIWGLARESGKFDDVIRYPAEDSPYEEERMNQLGL
ncbi:MAG: polysaccharide deacetylase family protein [Ignavibacteriaceae bacterium]|nr:polysaccharide deacetylase family protein [Ignavibacteriaceae bacterium]